MILYHLVQVENIFYLNMDNVIRECFVFLLLNFAVFLNMMIQMIFLHIFLNLIYLIMLIYLNNYLLLYFLFVYYILFILLFIFEKSNNESAFGFLYDGEECVNNDIFKLKNIFF